MVTPRKPAGLVLCDGALASNGRMQEAIEAAGWDEASIAAVLTAWASLDGHDVGWTIMPWLSRSTLRTAYRATSGWTSLLLSGRGIRTA